MVKSSVVSGGILFLAGLLISPYLAIRNVASEETASFALVDFSDQASRGRVLRNGALVGAQIFQINASSVEFDVDPPRHPIEGSLQLRFNHSLAAKQQFRIGVPNATRSTIWTTIQENTVQGISETWHPVAGNESVAIFSPVDAHIRTTVGGFLSRPPFGARVTQNSDVLISQSPDSLELPAIGRLGSTGLTPVAPRPVAETPIVLRGDHAIHFYSSSPKVNGSIKVVDVNAGKGPDAATVLLRHLDGTPLKELVISDDGDTTNGKVSTSRVFAFSVEGRPGSWYELDFRNTASDLRWATIALEGPVLFSRLLTIATVSAATGGHLPVDITLHTTKSASLTAVSTKAAPVRQLNMTDSDGNTIVLPVTTSKELAGVAIPAGTYTVHLTDDTLQLKTSDGVFSFQPPPVSLPRLPAVYASDHGLTIQERFRGNAVFWTYVDNGVLDLQLSEQDTNLYNGDDNVTITVSDVEGRLLTSLFIPDDGNTGNDSVAGSPQVESIHLEGLATGSYRIAIKGPSSGDFRTFGIQINQRKLVVEAFLPVGLNPCCYKIAPMDNSLDLYYSSLGVGNLTASTLHGAGRQVIQLFDDETGSPFASLDVNRTNQKFQVPIPVQHPLRLHLPVQDVSLAGPGYFSFTPDSFFYPTRFELVPWSGDIDKLATLVDYAIIDTTKVRPLAPPDSDGWYTWRHTWKAEELSLDDGKLQLVLQITNFNKKGLEGRTVNIRDFQIEWRVHTSWEDNAFLRWVHHRFS